MSGRVVFSSADGFYDGNVVYVHDLHGHGRAVVFTSRRSANRFVKEVAENQWSALARYPHALYREFNESDRQTVSPFFKSRPFPTPKFNDAGVTLYVPTV